jgi:hypothetical protein
VPLLAQLRDAKRDPAAARWRRSRKSPAPFRTAFAQDTHIVWADSGFAREEAALWVCLSPGSCPKSGRCRKRETRKSRRAQTPRDSRFLHTTLKRFNPDSAARVELVSIWFGSLRHAFSRTDDGLGCADTSRRFAAPVLSLHVAPMPSATMSRISSSGAAAESRAQKRRLRLSRFRLKERHAPAPPRKTAIATLIETSSGSRRPPMRSDRCAMAQAAYW